MKMLLIHEEEVPPETPQVYVYIRRPKPRKRGIRGVKTAGLQRRPNGANARQDDRLRRI